MKNEGKEREYPTGFEVVGGWMGGIGLAVAVYFLLFFSTAVDTPDMVDGISIGTTQVNNLGLMSDRQNGIIFGLGCAILGAILYGIGTTRPRLKQPSMVSGCMLATGIALAVIAVGAFIYR